MLQFILVITCCYSHITETPGSAFQDAHVLARLLHTKYLSAKSRSVPQCPESPFCLFQEFDGQNITILLWSFAMLKVLHNLVLSGSLAQVRVHTLDCQAFVQDTQTATNDFQVIGPERPIKQDPIKQVTTNYISHTFS